MTSLKQPRFPFRLIRKRSSMGKKELPLPEDTSKRTDALHDDSFSDTSRSSEGCLKIPTQRASLSTAYGASTASDPSAKVSFGNMEIYKHDHELGDNPAVSCGPPVTIAWKAFEFTRITVEDYESARPEPRQKAEMLMPRSLREDLLKNAGYPRSAMKKAADQAAVVRLARAKSSKDGSLRRKFQSLRSGVRK